MPTREEQGSVRTGAHLSRKRFRLLCLFVAGYMSEYYRQSRQVSMSQPKETLLGLGSWTQGFADGDCQ